MNLADLMQSIVSTKPPKFSIWFGEEQKVLDIYLDKMDTLGTVIRKQSVSSVLSVIDKKTLTTNQKKIFVVTDDTEFSKQEQRWEEVIKRVKLSKHILILRYNKINKTNKFYKRNKDYFIEFTRLDENVLCNYILKDLPELSESNAIKLCRLCDNGYGRISLEVDKIKRVGGKDKDFERLLEQGVIYSVVGDITFKLTDAVLYGDVKNANIYLEQAKRKDEPALRIISILYQGFRNMLSYQGLGKDKSRADERTGLDNKQLWLVKKNIGGYNNQELLRNILVCQQAESGIKLGMISNDIALEYVVIMCMK